MANECSVFEMTAPRNAEAPIRTAPFLAKQTLSATGVSAAFNASTKMVTVFSTLAGFVEFSSTTADPSGAGILFPINASVHYDFDVLATKKVRFTV